jgi:hypothetical protein
MMSIDTSIKQAAISLLKTSRIQALAADPKASTLYDRLRGKPFYLWNEAGHTQQDLALEGNCCFNHIMGLPTKQGKKHPLYDYEQQIFDALENDRYIAILKSTGLGVTELVLRYVIFKCLKDNEWKGRQVPIVVGPNISLATKLIRRVKRLFEYHNIYFEDRQQQLTLNDCVIEAFPSNHLSSFRSLESPALIMLDESDYFNKNETDEVMTVVERYLGKSDPRLCLISTPNQPDGLMYNLMQLPESQCIYRRLKLGYEVGLGKIYSQEEIEQAKQSRFFDREFDLKFAGGIGNLFSDALLNDCICSDDMYNPLDHWSTDPSLTRSMGIDPAFSASGDGSKFAIVITQMRDRQIEVIFARSYQAPEHNDIIHKIINLFNKHMNSIIYADASNPSIISSLKYQVSDWDFNKYAQDKRYINEINDPLFNENRINCLPVNWSRMGQPMLFNLISIMQSKQLKVHESLTDLVVALKSAYITNDKLDKERSTNNDLLDALMLACLNYKRKQTRVAIDGPLMVSSAGSYY